MNESFSKEVAIRSLLKSKGYKFDAKNQFWSREWSTNQGNEKVIEIAVKTEDGEWNKLMMTTSGHIFYAKETGNGII